MPARPSGLQRAAKTGSGAEPVRAGPYGQSVLQHSLNMNTEETAHYVKLLTEEDLECFKVKVFDPWESKPDPTHPDFNPLTDEYDWA